MTATLLPREWSEFQHYKKRSPPWIKLHRRYLDDREFLCLSDASKALAPLLWLLASEHENGVLPWVPADIMWRLRLTEEQLTTALRPLLDGGFFALTGADLPDRRTIASAMPAPCQQDSPLEGEGEGETEREGEAEGAAASASTGLPLEVEQALEPYTRSARMPDAVRAAVRGELQGIHGTAWNAATVVQAITDMQAAGVSPFNGNAFRGFLRGVAVQAARAKERKADESAAQERAEGETRKRATPRRATDGLPPDRVPSVGELLAAQGLVPPGTPAEPAPELTPEQKRKAIRDAAEHQRRMTKGTLEARGAA